LSILPVHLFYLLFCVSFCPIAIVWGGCAADDTPFRIHPCGGMGLLHWPAAGPQAGAGGRPLLERKVLLRKLLPLSPQALRYVEHVASGTDLFRAICELGGISRRSRLGAWHTVIPARKPSELSALCG
jgi:hypothetical protein